MGACFGEVQRRPRLGDRAHEALAKGQPRDVNGLLLEAPRGKQLQHAVAQQVDRRHFGFERAGNQHGDLVKLRLRGVAGRHHVVKAAQKLPCGGPGRHQPARTPGLRRLAKAASAWVTRLSMMSATGSSAVTMPTD